MPKITFLPSGVTVEVKAGTTVFQAAIRAEVPIPSQCGGKCACALCRVKVISGEALLSPMRWQEESHMGNAFFLTRERLSCQLQAFGDTTVEVSEVPVKEHKRGRYIPHALVRKREKLEAEAELARVRGEGAGDRRQREASGRGANPSKRPRRPKKPGTEARGAGAPAPGEGRVGKPPARRRRRSRNPGAPRSGDSRPPSGARPQPGSKDIDEEST